MSKSIKESYSTIKLDDISKQQLYSHIIKSSQDSQTKKKKRNLTPVIVVACSFLFIAMIMPMMSMGSSSQSPVEGTNPSTFNLSQLPSEISIEYAREQGFYVNVHEQTYNKEVLEDFLENVDKKIPTYIIIVRYTIEGDAIVTYVDYEYDFEIYHDTTRDHFGSQQITKYSYPFIGYYEDHLYAYQDKLNQNTIENGECFIIN